MTVIAMPEENAVRKISVSLSGSARLTRELIAPFLQAEPRIHLAAAFESVEEALAQPCAVQTDVIVLLIDRTLVDGVARAVEPLHSVSKAKVIVVMDSAGDEEVVRLAWAGVAGIFLTSGPAALLIKCICKVADGECWFDQNMVQAIIHRVAALSVKNAAEGSDQSLTKRELQVLRLVLDGLSNKEIAGRMELRETSVKSILQGLFQKNGVRSRSQLVRVALERRLAAGKAEGD